MAAASRKRPIPKKRTGSPSALLQQAGQRTHFLGRNHSEASIALPSTHAAGALCFENCDFCTASAASHLAKRKKHALEPQARTRSVVLRTTEIQRPSVFVSAQRHNMRPMSTGAAGVFPTPCQLSTAKPKAPRPKPSPRNPATTFLPPMPMPGTHELRRPHQFCVHNAYQHRLPNGPCTCPSRKPRGRLCAY